MTLTSTYSPTASYLDSLTECRFLPRIVRPTRIKKQSATLIDHIFTKDSGSTLTCGIIDTEIAGNNGYTDHLPTFIILKAIVPPKKEQRRFTISYFTNDGHKKLKLPRLMALLIYKSRSSYDDALLCGHQVCNH